MRDQLKFYRLSAATFNDYINTIYQFIKHFFDNKMSIFEEYGAFKTGTTFSLQDKWLFEIREVEITQVNYLKTAGSV